MKITIRHLAGFSCTMTAVFVMMGCDAPGVNANTMRSERQNVSAEPIEQTDELPQVTREVATDSQTFAVHGQSNGTQRPAHKTVEITASNFEELVVSGETPVLIDFWADWCGPCKIVGPSLESLAKEFGDKITIGKVNIDEQPRLASLFEISSIPALIYVKDGRVVSGSLGARSKKQIKLDIEKVLGS